MTGRAQAFLTAMTKSLTSAKSVSVGFLAGATYPDGTSVAMVAAIQNFGAPGANIPPRPFFSQMVRSKSPGWGESMVRIAKLNDYDAKRTLELMGRGIADQLQDSILEFDSPALKPSTIRARLSKYKNKGGGIGLLAKPLIETGVMIRAIDYEVDYRE